MSFIYKAEIVRDIIIIKGTINWQQVIKQKYNLSADYFNKYLTYCLDNGYVEPIYQKNNTVGSSNEFVFTGYYKATLKGQNFLK